LVDLHFLQKVYPAGYKYLKLLNDGDKSVPERGCHPLRSLLLTALRYMQKIAKHPPSELIISFLRIVYHSESKPEQI
jgi:hypothetical protein